MSALIVLLLAAAQPEFEYPAQMCEQVAHELNNQYVDGYISRDKGYLHHRPLFRTVRLILIQL